MSQTIQNSQTKKLAKKLFNQEFSRQGTLQNSQASQQSEINCPTVNRDSQPYYDDDHSYSQSQFDQTGFWTQQISQGSDCTNKSNSQTPLETTIVGTQVASQLDGSQSVKSQPVEHHPLQSQSNKSQTDGTQQTSVNSQPVDATQSAENNLILSIERTGSFQATPIA